MANTKILLDCIDRSLIVAELPMVTTGGVNDNIIEVNFTCLF